MPSSKVCSYLGPPFSSCRNSTVSDTNPQPWREDIVSWAVKFFLCFSFLSLLSLSIIQSNLTACRGIHGVGAGSSHWEVSITQDRRSSFCLALKISLFRCSFFCFFCWWFWYSHKSYSLGDHMLVWYFQPGHMGLATWDDSHAQVCLNPHPSPSTGTGS